MAELYRPISQSGIGRASVGPANSWRRPAESIAPRRTLWAMNIAIKPENIIGQLFLKG
jgi:hypothetical protein